MILSGESDIICATKYSLRELMKSENKNLSIIEIKKSGHIPSLEAYQLLEGYLKAAVHGYYYERCFAKQNPD